ncbi:hypothetical protein ACF1BU_05575 [Streptomyces sp. NPDC014724]|uniref:hypothetical protein n=1 Tax=unclassified Streptomyces TaxID=2593676 RepID=UPI0037035FB3
MSIPHRRRPAAFARRRADACEDAGVVIRAGIVRSAQLLGLQRTVGHLARGFAGDAIVVDVDPLADVSVLRTPLHVV